MSSHCNNRPVDRRPVAARAFARLARLVRALLLIVAMLGLGGCESPSGFFEAQPPAVDPPAVGESADKQADSPDKDKADSKGSDTAESLGVEVRSLDPGTNKAKRLLEQNFRNFLDREPLGFGPALYDMVMRDLRDLGERMGTLPDRLSRAGPRDLLFEFFPVAAIILLLVGFWLLDRAFLRWAKRWQAHIHIDFSRLATRALRGLVLLGGRVAPLLVLVVLSYFPVQALAEQADWSLFLTRALWLGVAYRAIHALLVVTFSGRIISMPAEHANRLETYAIWVTRVIFGFWIALAAIQIFDYRDQVYNVVLFGLQLSVAFAPVYLYFAKPSVMALLPEYESSNLYGFFKRLIDQYYYWILSLTVLLLLMRAAGYVKASTFILVRGYSIILLVIAAFVVGNTIKHFLRRRTEAIDVEEKLGERETSRPQLAASLEQFLLVGGGILLVVLILELLAVREAVIALLRTPLISVGNVSVSLFNILAIGLIVFATILAIKMIKAILNAKVYPTFSVDVGVAYAINTLLSYVLVVVGFLLVLGALGVNLSAIAVVLASLGVGIGFGLQTLTENLISGFIILFGRSVKKGDFITVRDTYGRVEAVGARSVVIRTPDNYELLIPSKEIVGGQIINWTFRDGHVRLHIPVGVGYNADPPQVKQVLLHVAQEADYILDRPAPEVWLVNFGDSAVNFELLVYFDCRQLSPNRLKGLIYFDIWAALKEAGIEIPFPQRDLHVRSAEMLPEVGKMIEDWRRRGEDVDEADAGEMLAPPAQMEAPDDQSAEDEED